MIKWILSGFLLAFSAYAVHEAFKYTRLISNIFFGLIYKPSDTVLTAMGEKVTILDSKDEEIETILVEKKDARKIAIFSHDSGATKESWEKYAYFLPKLGFHMLAVDFRNKPDETEAQSLTQWPTEEDVQRLLTVIRWVKKAFSPEIEVVLFGISKGANISFAASFLDASITAVIADGLFSMKEIFRDYIRKWAPVLVRPNFFGERFPEWVVTIFTNLGFWHCQNKSGKRFIDVEKLLRKKHPPLLMIHGEADDYIPLTHQKFLEKIYQGKEPLQRLVVPEAGHNEAVLLSRELYERKITEFLKVSA